MNTYSQLLEVSGVDAAKLLQGQITCNVAEVTAFQSRLGAHCNPQGRILSLFRLFSFNEKYYLQLPQAILPIAMSALQKYAVFFKVTISPVGDQLYVTTYSNPQAIKKLHNIFSALPEKTDEAISHADKLITRLPSETPHFAVISQENLLIENDTEQNYHRLNITAGIPTIYPNTSGKLLPHEINLHLINAISFNKGCYTGQEIIARMHYRGQLKKQLYRAKVVIDTNLVSPRAGDFIYKDRNVYELIVDSAWEDANTYQLLVIAAKEDIKNRTFFLDPDEKYPLQFLS